LLLLLQHSLGHWAAPWLCCCTTHLQRRSLLLQATLLHGIAVLHGRPASTHALIIGAKGVTLGAARWRELQARIARKHSWLLLGLQLLGLLGLPHGQLDSLIAAQRSCIG
jgi:hypothetical protein